MTNIQVYIRAKPHPTPTTTTLLHTATQLTHSHLSPHPTSAPTSEPKTYTFDGIFATDTTQSTLYENTVSQLITKVVNGVNVTVLAYGQTGTGKTYTMGLGSHVPYDGGDIGLIGRSMADLFKYLTREKTNDRTNWKVSVSFMELYNEELRDLLVKEIPRSRIPQMNVGVKSSGLVIREEGGVISVNGVIETEVTSAIEVYELVKRGSLVRSTSATEMNVASSRSHAILVVNVAVGGPDGVLHSKFQFVDLAGSERLKRTGAEGERMKEGISINQGLSVLGNVISSLCQDAKSHIPYRDSKLTRLLKDSLGGNSVTLLVACVSGALGDYSETSSTLMYANRAKNIKNREVVNLVGVGALGEEYRLVKDRLREKEAELVEFERRFEAREMEFSGVLKRQIEEFQDYKKESEGRFELASEACKKETEERFELASEVHKKETEARFELASVELERMNEENERLKSQVEESKVLLENMQIVQSSHLKRMEELSQQNSTMWQSSSTVKGKLSELTNDLKIVEDELKHEKESKEALKEANDSAIKVLKDLNEIAINDLNNSIEQLKASNDSEIIHLNNTIKDSKELNDIAIKDLQDLNDIAIKQLKELNESEIKDLKELNDIAIKDLKDLNESEINDLNNSIKESKALNDTAIKDLKELKELNELKELKELKDLKELSVDKEEVELLKESFQRELSTRDLKESDLSNKLLQSLKTSSSLEKNLQAKLTKVTKDLQKSERSTKMYIEEGRNALNRNKLLEDLVTDLNSQIDLLKATKRTALSISLETTPQLDKKLKTSKVVNTNDEPKIHLKSTKLKQKAAINTDNDTPHKTSLATLISKPFSALKARKTRATTRLEEVMNLAGHDGLSKEDKENKVEKVVGKRKYLDLIGDTP